jgi:AGCS family alanine or glycine:cation symporter
MLVLIIGTGLFVSIRTKFFQVRKFDLALKETMGKTFKQMAKKEKSAIANEKAISPFEAFCTAVSGTVGTGNIVGVTTAIISGGPGAVLWMWISAFFGMVTKYAEITLGVFFRKKDEKGEYIGGPMYYIEKGAKMKWLAILFAVFTMLAAIGMSSVQADTIQSTWNATFHIPSWISGIVIAIVTALVVIGGIKRIGKVTSIIVPFMAISFIVMALIVICVNVAAIPAVFASIFTSAFTVKSALSGFAGYGIMMAMRYGFARGVFSNEAGLGSSCIAHSSSTEIEPVRQGLWGILEIFIDTFIVCTLTALFVLTSGVVPIGGNGAATALSAFTSIGGVIGEIFKYSYSIVLPLLNITFRKKEE